MKPGRNIHAASLSLILQLLLVSLPVLAGNPAAQLAFSTQPVGSTLGAGLGSVIVQLADKSGSNVLSSGTVINVSLSKPGGLGGATSLTTDAGGKVTFNSLKVNLPGNNYTLTATASGLASASSQKFNVAKGSATGG